MILEATDLFHAYSQGNTKIPILKGISLSARAKETVAIMGPSGCGKSTLISCLGGLIKPNQGRVKILGTDLTLLKGDPLVSFRARHIGIVFQQFHLLPHLNALENASLPLELRGDPHATDSGLKALAQVQMDHRAHHFPHQLSRGESQRVAIARVLAARPQLILADEPTASLDRSNGMKVTDLLVESALQINAALILVTHDFDMARRCQKTLRFEDGLLRGPE